MGLPETKSRQIDLFQFQEPTAISTQGFQIGLRLQTLAI